jgi:hypothetical protein
MQYYGQNIGGEEKDIPSQQDPWEQGVEPREAVYGNNAIAIFGKSNGGIYKHPTSTEAYNIAKHDVMFSVDLDEGENGMPALIAALNGAYAEAKVKYPNDEKMQTEYINCHIKFKGMSLHDVSYERLQHTRFAYTDTGVTFPHAYVDIPFGADLMMVAPLPKDTESFDWEKSTADKGGRIPAILVPRDSSSVSNKFTLHMNKYLTNRDQYNLNFRSKTADPRSGNKRVTALEHVRQSALVQGLIMLDRLMDIGIIDQVTLRDVTTQDGIVLKPVASGDATRKEIILALANMFGLFGDILNVEHSVTTEKHRTFGREAARQISMAQFAEGVAPNYIFGYDKDEGRINGSYGSKGQNDTKDPYGKMNHLQLNAGRLIVSSVCEFNADVSRNRAGKSLAAASAGYRFPMSTCAN